MPALVEGGLSFSFNPPLEAEKYDDWPFYQKQFQSACGGNKGVDFLVLDSANTEKLLWLVEVKDYRRHQRVKTSDLSAEVALKIRDTLAGLAAAAMQPSYDQHAFARRAVKAHRLRIVLHLEQPGKSTKLYPRVFDLADVQQKLRQTVRAMDPHPKVVERASMDDLPWTAAFR